MDPPLSLRVQISLNLIAPNPALVFTLPGPSWAKSKSLQPRRFLLSALAGVGGKVSWKGGGSRDAAET